MLKNISKEQWHNELKKEKKEDKKTVIFFIFLICYLILCMI
jgi:hypothetical protein